MDDNPYQSPESPGWDFPPQQRRRAPLIVRAFLSGWTGMAITLFLLACAVMAASGLPAAETYMKLLFVAFLLAFLWFSAHGIATLIWR
jgi:hypothetical protein